MSPCPLPTRRRHSGRRILGVAALLTALLLACLTVVLGATTPARAEDRVRIDLTAITPKVTASNDTVTLSGTVTNTSGTTLTGLQAYLWRDEVVRTTRAELDTAEGPVGARYVDKYANLGTGDTLTLTPGQQSAFTVSAPLSALGIPARDGVTMIGVQVRGSYGSGNTTLGRARAWLPQDLGPQTGQPRVVSVVVLSSAPSRISPGIFSDDHLAQEIAPGGRLDTLVRAAATGGRTHLIDPALIIALQDMAKGYTLSGGAKGTGDANAATWLQYFDTLSTPGYRLPYATPDIDLLGGLNHADVVHAALDPATLPADVANLPVVVLPAGGLLTRRGLATLTGTTSSGPTPTPTPGATTATTSPATSSPTPSSGTSRPPVVLAAQPTDGSDITAGSTTPTHWSTSEGPTVVTYDARALTPGPDAAGTDAQQRQALTSIAYLDTLAGRPAQVRLVTDATTAHADDLDTSPRTSFASLLEGGAATVSDAILHDPQSTTSDQAKDIARAANATIGLASMFADPQVAADLTWRAVASVASNQWSAGSASTGTGSTSASYDTYRDRQQAQVRRITDGDAVAISARPVLLTARQDTQFPVTVTNHLDVPVSVRLQFESENAERLHVAPVDIRTIGAGEAIGVVAVPRVAANGSYTVVAQLTTPSGTDIGIPVEIDVQATQAGRVGWILMIVSGLVVIGTTVLRIKQVRAERSRA
ncbi:DUF6049 family protein [Raineyella fluvialis]|uniref:Uncharacterized protein n=1 Tax=Raineyella fluvialis TaxID=2662261 RepID=A0A5Q2FF34_9ACTN|nr:DUF6049 family protein [Raineyella fluvialis]QGF23325.1 hypothetical protein Rai3103_06220 [Raineyella fluvialis]